MTKREATLANGAWLALCFFWGTTYLAIRVGIESLPPALFSGFRFLIAGTVLMAACRIAGARLPRGREWVDLFVVGVSLVAIANGLVVWAAHWVPSGLTALLVSMMPFWMAAIQWVLPGGERLGVKAILGLVVGFAGLVLLLWPKIDAVTLDRPFLVAVLGLEVGCLSWAAGSVYSIRRPSGTTPLMGAAAQMLCGGAVMSMIGLALGEADRFAFTGRTFAAFLYLIVFGSIVGYGSYLYALSKLPASRVSLYAYVNPVIAVLAGWWLLNETDAVEWRSIVAMAVILGGVALVKSQPARVPVPRPVRQAT